ncbi:MAG: nitroreductase family protein [Deltaproteobacteria bacterium]|jgi:nitroreductase|nr:MAG: nitroreductase family protein [Deltaproteobacteria bacterium]
MDVFDSMKGRQSIRRFRKDPVPHDKILRMVEAATWAPSAGNAQNARFLVVEDPALLARMKGIVDNLLSRITGKEVPPDKINYHNLFAAAPAAVCVVGKPYESATDRNLREKDPERHRMRRYQVNAGLQSVASAITQFLLAAYSLGYGTCWMTGPLVAKPELESALSIRPPEELLAVIALGVPDSPPPKPPRRPPEEITDFR